MARYSSEINCWSEHKS